VFLLRIDIFLILFFKKSDAQSVFIVGNSIFKKSSYTSSAVKVQFQGYNLAFFSQQLRSLESFKYLHGTTLIDFWKTKLQQLIRRQKQIEILFILTKFILFEYEIALSTFRNQWPSKLKNLPVILDKNIFSSYYYLLCVEF
jgi:hypothetical protein